MKSEFKLNTATYIFLIALTIASYMLAGSAEKMALVILILASFKILGVTFQFMELKSAHTLWKVLVFLIILFINIGTWAFLG